MASRRARLAAVLAASAVMGVASQAGSAAAGRPAEPLLPDVVVRPITEVRIERSPGVRLLRFATIVGNRGPGVVELRPDRPAAAAKNDCDGNGDPLDDRKAFQRIFGDTDGDGVFTRGVDERIAVRFAGCSVFHPDHMHWHLEEFARYRLERPATGVVVASSEKVSFCVRDSLWFRPGLAGSPAVAHYGACDQDSVTGLSVGWADYYASSLPGQELDIRGLPDGRYCLRTEADPAGRLRESDETNNGRSTLVRIDGKRAADLGRWCR